MRPTTLEVHQKLEFRLDRVPKLLLAVYYNHQTLWVNVLVLTLHQTYCDVKTAV